ncbi:hypothetical protein DBZ36_04630 [Alginatibacterium sediminis]|uniref:MepB family protein n=1 Tax=Alginatibacterium sediminis TaxID=2164068 RepID=A0A420EGB5_9ALTE|nr:MepB family protein [Alginatibacterium sediminis]RKF19749.1 hypothetical protein DBZ36_04630 [Alginatibacterium sediminis]
MLKKNYRDEILRLLTQEFVPAGYLISSKVSLDPVAESVKYDALHFSLNDKRIVYRKGKVTPDRPGAFLALWQRPAPQATEANKPVPYTSSDLDFLFVRVEGHSMISDEIEQSLNCGLFVFPVSVLVDKGIVSSPTSKGKTGFRVFAPWSQDRGTVGTKVFSASGKKTQRWQLPFFLEVDEKGLIDTNKLNKLLSHAKV